MANFDEFLIFKYFGKMKNFMKILGCESSRKGYLSTDLLVKVYAKISTTTELFD